MSDTQGHADHITMSGDGLYSLATIGAKHVIDKATPQVLDALDVVLAARQTAAVDLASPWCCSDMGCADGGTSLDLWRRVIEHLRRHDSTNSDIQIVYADQARNDFNALVRILHGLTEFDSYLPGQDGVYALQSGASFYLPILPRASLDLGFSATAMHWLSKKPVDIPDHVHMVGASGTVLDQFAAQAQLDWQTILLRRANELKPGGQLVLVNFCRDEQGRHLGNTTGANMFDCFNRLWQQRVDDNTITAAEYAAMTLPQYYNTVEEFSAPFNDASSAVRQAGLRLTHIHTDVVACPFAEDYAQHRDAVRFADEYIPTIRSWNESTYYGGLDSSRSDTERRALIEAYYESYADMVRAEPGEHRMDYVHAYMTITREP